MVRLKVAMVFLSARRRALETAEAERAKTTRAGTNETMPLLPLDARLRKRDAIPE